MLDYKGVSEMTGLAVQSLRQYQADGKMPKPDGKMGGSPVWYSKTIRGWMRARGGDTGHQGGHSVKFEAGADG